jgi:DNA-binding CsgD family transcriptional regulator
LVRPLPRTEEDSEANLICQLKQSLSGQSQKDVSLSGIARRCPIRPVGFVLYERSSGAARFRVNADPDGSLPVEQVAGLLAMHCLVRGQAPEDFEVMVITRAPLLHAAAERAEQLLAAGRAICGNVKISRREQDVLTGVLQNLANKEIAAKLNVSERTVKFHVSSLLAKFGVTDRLALRQEVFLGQMPAGVPVGQVPPHTLFGFPVSVRDGKVQHASTPVPAQPAAEVPRAAGRVFSIFPRERFAT